MQSYPSIALGSIAITDWDRLRELAKKKGKPYADREESIAIVMRRKDWMLAICKLYRKGVWEVSLEAIRNPFKKESSLREIKQKEIIWAEEKAREILAEL